MSPPPDPPAPSPAPVAPQGEGLLAALADRDAQIIEAVAKWLEREGQPGYALGVRHGRWRRP